MSQQDITPFNPDAFKLSWELFTLDGYNGDLETYQALLNKNSDAVNVSYKLFVQDGYNGDINSFLQLMGIGEKKNLVEPSAPTSPEEVTVSDTEVVEEPGSSDVSVQEDNISVQEGDVPVQEEQGYDPSGLDIETIEISKTQEPFQIDQELRETYDAKEAEALSAYDPVAHESAIMAADAQETATQILYDEYEAIRKEERTKSGGTEGERIIGETERLAKTKYEDALNKLNNLTDESLGLEMKGSVKPDDGGPRLEYEPPWYAILGGGRGIANSFMSILTGTTLEQRAHPDYTGPDPLEGSGNLPSDYHNRGYREGRMVLKDGDPTDFFEQSLQKIDQDLISETEESVVPLMNYHFGDYGFKFEEDDVTGDEMLVTAANGNTISVELDAYGKDRRGGYATELKTFLFNNRQESQTLHRLEAGYTQEKHKIQGGDQVKKLLKAFKSDTDELRYQQTQYVQAQELYAALANKDPNEVVYLKGQDGVDYATTPLEFKKKIQAAGKVVEEGERRIIARGQELDGIIGEWYEMKTEQSSTTGLFYNALLDGMGRIGSGHAMNMVDAAVWAVGKINGDTDKEIDELRKQIKYGQYPNEPDPYTNPYSEFANNPLYDGSDEKMGMAHSSRVGMRWALGMDETTKEATQETKEGFWGGALVGMTESIPAMIGPPVIKVLNMFAQVKSHVDEEMENNPNFHNVTEGEKNMVAIPLAIVVGVLEYFGFRNVMASKGVAATILMKALGKYGTIETGKMTFRQVVKQEVNNLAGQTALVMAAGAVAEFETGVAQEIADITAKEIYNAVKEKDMFQTPESWADGLSQVLRAGAQEAVGGFVLGSVPATINAATTGNFATVSEQTFEVFESIHKEGVVREAYVEKIKQAILAGTMTQKKGKEALAAYDQVSGVMNQIPTDLSTPQKKKLLGNLLRQQALSDYVNKYDKQLTKRQQKELAGLKADVEVIIKEGETEVTNEEVIEEVRRRRGPEGDQEVYTQSQEFENVKKELIKKKQDAIQKRSSEKVDVQVPTTDGGKVVEGDPQSPTTAKSDTQIETDPKAPTQEEVEDLEALIDEQTGVETETVEVVEGSTGKKVTFKGTTDGNISVTEQTEQEGDPHYKSEMFSQENPNTTQQQHENTILNIANKAIKAIAKILPDTRIVLHKSEAAFNKSVSKLSQGSRGAFSGATNTIHINIAKANNKTVAHEVFHALLYNRYGADIRIAEITQKMVRALRKSVKDKALKAELDLFIKDYTEFQNEEYLSELVGILSGNFQVLTTPQKNLIQRWLEKVSKLIGYPISIDSDTQLLNLLNTISSKVSQGQELTEEDVKGFEVVEEAVTEEKLAQEQVEEEAAMDEQRAEIQERNDLPSGLFAFLFENLGKIHVLDYDNNADINTRKDYGIKINKLLRKTGERDLDEYAQELSEQYGETITPGDITDYLTDRAASKGKYTAKNVAKARELGMTRDQKVTQPEQDTEVESQERQQKTLEGLVNMYQPNPKGFIGPNIYSLESLRQWAADLGYGVKEARMREGQGRGRLTGYYLTKNGRFFNPRSSERQQKVIQEKQQKVFNKFDTELEIINTARNLNFTDGAIFDYLTRVRAFGKKAVRELMKVDIDALKTIPPSLGNIPGGMAAGIKLYTKINNFYNKLQQNNIKAKKKLTEEQIMDQTLEYLESQPEYKKLADTYKIKGETKSRKGLSTQQANIKIEVAKALGGKQSHDLGNTIRNARLVLNSKSKGIKELKKIQRELRNFLRKTLPADIYTKTETLKLIRKIEQATTENRDQIMKEVMEFSAEKNNVRLEKEIANLLEGKYQIKINGILKGIKIDNATRKRLKDIVNRINPKKGLETQDSVIKYLADLQKQYNELAENPSKTEAEFTEMANLQIIMNLVNAQNLMGNTDLSKVSTLAAVEAELKQIISTGRTLLKEELKEAHNRYKKQFERVFLDVIGREGTFEDQAKQELEDEGVSNPTQEEIDDKTTDIIQSLKDNLPKETNAAKKTKVKYLFRAGINSILRGMGRIVAKNSDAFLLMAKISKLPADLFEGITQEEVTERIDAASRSFKQRMMQNEAMVIFKLKELFGRKYKKTISKFTRNIERNILIDPVEVENAKQEYANNPTKENEDKLNHALKKNKIDLSQNKMYYLYNQYKDPSNHAGFETKWGKNYQEIMKQIEEQLDPDLKEFADWQVDVLYPLLYNHYNQAYKDIYRIEMPYNVNYAGMVYRDGIEPEGIDLLAGITQYHNAVSANSTKMRENNKLAIKDVDGTDALFTYMRDMEYFAAYARPVTDIDKLFTNKVIKGTIENLYGRPTMEAIETMIKKIANKGMSKADGQTDAWVNAMQDAFILSRLGLNPVVMLKQLTSFVTYGNDIGYGTWMKNATLGRFFSSNKNVKGVWKEIRENSVYLQDRKYNSITKAIETYTDSKMEQFMPASMIGMPARYKESLINILMYTTRVGDIGAIMLGGVPNYVHYKEQFLKKNPKATDQQAIDHAIRKFERDTKRTQQSTDLQDRDHFQTKNAYFRAMNMFLTTPKQYLRKEIYGLREFYRLLKSGGKEGKGTKTQTARTFLTYHMIMPMFFQYVANGLPGVLADWDDEDESDLMRAAVLGNLNGLFLLGEVFVLIADLVQGKPWAAQDMKNLPALTQVNELGKKMKRYMATKDPVKKAEKLTELILEMGQTTGIPANNLHKIFKNAEALIDGGEDPAKVIMRLFNYGDYQINGKKIKTTKNKKKSSEEWEDPMKKKKKGWVDPMEEWEDPMKKKKKKK
tara:strand:+ start:44 stop:8305 length:8262 start_codon:yes stop_codon:yes gene_type:complete